MSQKGVMYNPKKVSRPYGVMVEGAILYYATEDEALQRLRGVVAPKKPPKPKPEKNLHVVKPKKTVPKLKKPKPVKVKKVKVKKPKPPKKPAVQRLNRYGKMYGGWETKRVLCSICKFEIGIGRIKAHEEACKRRAAGIKYVRKDRPLKGVQVARYTYYNSKEIFMEYEGKQRSLFEIAAMRNFPIGAVRKRWMRKRKEKTIEYLFGPIIPAEQYYKNRTYKKKGDVTDGEN